MDRYAIGLDFGTLSVRSQFLNLDTGEEKNGAEYIYPHGIMDKTLPDGTLLPEDFALEHPQDFLDGMACVIRDGMASAGVESSQIAGIGLDVTSATVLPLDETGEPLCFIPEFSRAPHAWMKLWKHHSAGDIAGRMLAVARQRGESWIDYYGGWLSEELFLPKAVELAVKAPQIYAKTHVIMEAADWLVWKLTGRMVRSISLAGCTGNYRVDTGYPSRAYFAECYPEAETLPDKLQGDFLRLGECAGYLTKDMAQALGLQAGTPVGIPTLDSHIGVIGCGASRVGDMVTIIGTSACTMLNAERPGAIPGIYLGAEDANVPGMYGYEGSQNCVGDMLAWFVDNCVSHSCYLQAEAEEKNIHTYLTEKAAQLKPGQSGLLALDWFHGVRTPLMDFSLTASIAGLTIHTKPEHIYRALMEGAAFGLRRIIDTFETAGCRVDRIIAGGGIPGKNPVMMQLYADITGKTIYLCGSKQSCALGSAILGAAAAGEGEVPALMEKYVRLSDTVYRPVEENRNIYEKLYELYTAFSDQMADANSVGRKLLALKKGI